jgi:hypothetical protein
LSNLRLVVVTVTADWATLLTVAASPVFSLGLPARVYKEEHHDNHQKNNLPKNEYRRVEPAEFIARVKINDERSETYAADQPDDLPFGVPH